MYDEVRPSKPSTIDNERLAQLIHNSLYRKLADCSFFFFSSRRRHTRSLCDWSSDVCSSDLKGRRPSHGNPGRGVPQERGGNRVVPESLNGEREIGQDRQKAPQLHSSQETRGAGCSPLAQRVDSAPHEKKASRYAE